MDTKGVGLRHLVADSLAPSRILLAAFFFGLLYIAGSALYSITFHPLAKYPGPKLCAITRIPFWIKYTKGKDVYWLQKLHNQYGPVVRYGPTDLSYITAQAWKDIFGVEKGTRENTKARDISPPSINGYDSILTTPFEHHARLRRIFSPAFSERALRQQEHMFKKYADIMVSKLREMSCQTAPVEMVRMLNFASFDCMAELTFGQPLGLLAKNEYSPWVRSIFESLKMMPFTTMIQYYSPLAMLFKYCEPKWINEQRKEHCKHSADRVDQRLEQGSDQPDIWNLVISAKESGDELPLGEMHANAELFMLAGSETTGSLMSGMTYFIMKHPDVFRRLSEEIRGSFASAADIKFDRLATLRYLNACMKETLRIYPPTPIGSPRVAPEGGQIIVGRWVPAGTYLSVHHFSAYHSATNFRDPDSFLPERWLGDPRYADDNVDVFQPFSYGPRNCIGQNMAMHEMRLILASLVYNFDLELCGEGEGEDWADQLTFALWIKKPLMVRLRPVVP
ncbi:cytochrome P450 [Xylariomycetidae sp. FL0641]|nr:cytochrome P450 [Xylariomycetidae sp. FL0641]